MTRWKPLGAPLAIQFEVKLSAEPNLRVQADSWTHEERCKRLVGVFDDAWRAQGGDNWRSHRSSDLEHAEDDLALVEQAVAGGQMRV